MSKSISQTSRMTEGVIWKQLLQFFFPILFGSFFQLLYNTTDTVIVGQFVGKEALSAVGGSPAMILLLVNGFFMGLSSGATVIISQYFGAKQDDDVAASVHTAVALSLLGGVVMTLITFFFSPWLLRVMETPAEILEDSILYMQIYAVGMIPAMIYNIGSGIFRAVGDSRRPLWYLIASCCMNILLDIVFVVILHMGVAGVSIATVLSQLFSAILVLAGLFRTKDVYRLELCRIRLHMDKLRQTIRIGLPTGLQSTMYSFSTIIIQAYINRLGTDSVAAWASFCKVDSLFWMMIGAFGITVSTFVGQNYGVRNFERVRRGVRICNWMAFGASALLSVLFFIVGRNLYYLFVQDEAVIDIGYEILLFLAPMYVLFVSIEMFSGALRGMGDAFFPMVINFLGVCGVRLLWLFLVVPINPTLYTILASFPITWTFTSLIFIFYYRKRSAVLLSD